MGALSGNCIQRLWKRSESKSGWAASSNVEVVLEMPPPKPKPPKAPERLSREYIPCFDCYVPAA